MFHPIASLFRLGMGEFQSGLAAAAFDIAALYYAAQYF